MASIRFHLDEQLPRAVAGALQRAGIEVETTPDAGLLGASDEQHLAHARTHGRVIVTEDADYLRLHGEGHAHCGIAYFAHGPRPIGDLVEGLVLLHAVLTAEQLVGTVEYL